MTMKIVVFISISLLGGVVGYINAYNYVIKRSPIWVACEKSNDRTSVFLDGLTKQIKETDWCEAGRSALKGQQHDK